MAEERTLYLTNVWATVLFLYYFATLLAGFFLAIFALLPSVFRVDRPDIFLLAVAGSIGMSLNGAAIFYIRKLYKLCFSEKFNQEVTDNLYARRLGTIVYFLGRPLFSVGFSVLIIIGLRSGFMLTSSGPLELNYGFIYIAMFFSFFAGFLSGRFVRQLEQSGERVIAKVIEMEKEEIGK